MKREKNRAIGVVRRVRQIAAASVLLLATLLVTTGCCGNEPGRIEGEALGTSWRVLWRSDAGSEEVQARTEAVLARTDELFSTWRSDSVLARWNRNERDDAPTEFLDLLAYAEEVGQLSGGAFDPRVGQQVADKGFAPSGTGPLDLSAVAKGWAVDRIAEELSKLGVAAYLVEVGGEVRVAAEPGGEPWGVGLEAPRPGAREITYRASVENVAIATSGTYRQYRADTSGATTNHFVVPATGGSPQGFFSYTVFARTCAEADAWATAFCLMPPERALALARERGLGLVHMCWVEGSTFEVAKVGDVPPLEYLK